MMSVFIEALPGAVDRFYKRKAGEPVTPKDYKVLWAETTESGTGRIYQIDKDSVEIAPKFRLVARKIEGCAQWDVQQEKLAYDEKFQASSLALGASRMDLQGQFYTAQHPNCYVFVKSLGAMNEADMVRTLSAADMTERSVGHISGLTRSNDRR